MEIEIKKLTTNLIEDYIDFFDNRAFADNREWSACYCVFYHWKEEYEKSAKLPGVDIHEHNRNLAVELIKRGVLQGYLAYFDRVVVGWCNSNDKSAYERLNPLNRPDLWDEADKNKKIKCVTCYTIAPDMRRKGIATKLLRTVCEDAAKDGYNVVEAYPRKGVNDVYTNYHGYIALYEKYGFSVHKELEKEFIVRKNIGNM